MQGLLSFGFLIHHCLKKESMKSKEHLEMESQMSELKESLIDDIEQFYKKYPSLNATAHIGVYMSLAIDVAKHHLGRDKAKKFLYSSIDNFL